MNCTYHNQYPISLICIYPHQCQFQRKLCVDCQYKHGVDIQYTVPIHRFQEMAVKKFQAYEHDQTFEKTKLKMNSKFILSQMENIMEKYSEQIKQILNIIDMIEKSILNIISEKTNLAELSYSDVEQLVQTVVGQKLNDWNSQKQSYCLKLEKIKNWFDQEIEALSQKLNQKMNDLKSVIQQNLKNSQGLNLVQRKADLYEVLASLEDIDEQIFSYLTDRLLKENISDYLEFLSKDEIQMQYEQSIFYIEKLSTITADDVKKNFNKIYNLIKQIYEIDINTEFKIETIKILINKQSEEKKIIKFLKFLVQLTAQDNKFIECGSNSLKLLIQMKVDLTNHNFENIKIKNISLVGANLVKCNLNGSKFDDVDISGMNLNGAQLFNCQWTNLTIHELHQFDGHSSIVKSVCFSPDGTKLASGSADYSIRIWDVRTGQNSILDCHSEPVTSVCYSYDGSILAAGNDNKSIRLWDVKTGKVIAHLDGHSSCVNSVSFSPDGTTLASGSNDKSIRLWDVKTGLQIAHLDGHSSCVNSVSFSPDGTTLASGSNDKSIRLWSVSTEKETANLDGHTGSVQSVCFSPDGTKLASGGADKSIRLWDVKTRQQRSKLDGHIETVWSVCFSFDCTFKLFFQISI